MEAEVASLKAQLEAKEDSTTEVAAPVPATSTSGITSVDLPFTNKAMGQKLDSYRVFTAKYLVKAQQDKYIAVQSEKKKWVDHYTALMDEAGGKDFQWRVFYFLERVESKNPMGINNGCKDERNKDQR